MLPPDPRVQHEQDPLQRKPIIKRLATRVAEAPLPLGQQRLDPLPQPIWQLPRLRPHRHPPRLTTGADGLRYRERGPFIQLELLSLLAEAGRPHLSGSARSPGRKELLSRQPSSRFDTTRTVAVRKRRPGLA